MKNNCENCPMRARYDLNPKSFWGRLWRWHINFCPGWKDYMKSIDESTRERLIEKYRLKKNTREWTDEDGQEINVQALKAINTSILINMEHQILIFTTSVSCRKEVRQIKRLLGNGFSIFDISVDLEDWEKVLRIECTGVSESEIISKLREMNINAAVLNH